MTASVSLFELKGVRAGSSDRRSYTSPDGAGGTCGDGSADGAECPSGVEDFSFAFSGDGKNEWKIDER
jgi:hypothetical protein